VDRLCKILGPCIRSGEELDDDIDLLDELHGVCVSSDADVSPLLLTESFDRRLTV